MSTRAVSGTDATRSEPSDGNRLVDFHPVLGMRFEILRSGAETDGELFEAINWLDAHMPGPPPHVHPRSSENFEVLDGTLDVFVEGEWKTFTAGDKVTVPPGVEHSWRNPSDQPARVHAVHRPAVEFEEFHRGMADLIARGKVKSMPPKDPRSAIYLAMHSVRYAQFLIINEPPNWLLKTTALIGRGLRFKLDD
jgi:quercetin dioxygenase-like cupin family protein